MDEKVERAAENNNVSRQVGSRIHHVTNEAFLPSGHGIAYEPTFIPPNLRPLIFGKGNGGVRVANYSVQTGEEFALQFAQEASRTQRRVELEQVPLSKANAHESNNYVYEDLTGILGIRRVDSGTNSEISILGAERGNLSGYGSHCKPSYNDSLQGIQTSRSGNDGGYHLDDGSFPSTQQTGLNHPSCSMHQSYHSGLSTDSSQGKVKFMCSFGGKILPRPSDGRLRYVGGETRIITVSKDVGYEELMQKIIDVYGQALVLKYQLPGEDLDALVSVSSDEDLENMMEEYYKLDNKDGFSRLRIFLFTGSDNELTHFDVIADLRHSKQQYVDAVNGIMDMSTRKHSDSMVSFSSHLDNLIGLDVAENCNTGRRAQEDMDSLRPQYLKDGQKIVNFPNVVPLSSKPLVSHSAFAIKSLTFSAPFSSLPMHVTVKQSAVAETPMHFSQAPINLHPHSVVMPSEGIRDIDYGRPISSSAAFQPDFQYTHTESKTLQDSASNQNNDFLLPSHFDSMYKGDGRFTDTKVAQPILDLRSDGLQSVDLQRITQYRPPVHQPVWPRFVTEQYSYTPTDYVPQVNSGGVYLQHCVQQHTMQNTQSANHNTAAPKLANPVHLTHDDEVEAPQGSSLNNDPGLNTLNQVASSLNQGGGVQSIAQGEQTHNTSHVDQQYISTRVLQDDNQFNGDFCPTASADSSENLHAQAVYQQGFPSNLSHPDEHFTHQQTLSQEVVTNLNERFIRPQALPHVLSDNVLQTHATKSVHIASERVPIYQGHHSDGLIGTGPSHVGPRTTQESLLSFLDQGVVGDAESKVHQDERISPTYPGWRQGKASHSSGESLKEQHLFHSNFSENLDESDKFFEQKTLETDDKMPAARRTRTDQFDSSNDEQISQLSGVDHAKPAASYGVTKPPEDISTLVSVGLDTSYEASQKTESPETLVPTSYQLKVSITTGQVGTTYIVTEAMQTSQLSERINHSALPRPGSSAQEAQISIPLEEHTAHHHIGNAHLQLPTFDQRINNERLTETGSNPFLTTTGVEACVPSSISGMWWDGMRSERDYTNVEASRYTCEPKGNSIDELANDKFPSTVNDMGKPQCHPAQFLGKSLIDDDYGHLYPVSGILSNARFIDELPGSSSMHVPVSSEDGIYQRTVPLNHNISKGLFHQATADQAGSDEINESNDFKSDFDAMVVALDHVNLHEKLDMERKGELLNFSEMTDALNSNFPPTSTLSDSKWGAASEDVRVDDNILLEKMVEVADEDSTIIEGSILNHDSDNDEARIEDSDKDEAASDAVIAEFEAIAHGLQIIKNADLEELRELGSGTFGTVYHGKWRGSDVAIKRIKNSCFMGRPSEQERMRADFWREALMLAQMHHPNVVAFYGVVPDGPGGTLATVTEYMVNGSLKQVLQRKDRSIDRRKRLSIAMDAAFGMEYLHSKNIVHFDLKCENLLVNMRDPQRPICKVGDLGLSKIKHQTLVSGGVRGTLPWMAPELLNGSSNMVSEKVDVFSFGIVMWELLTGEEPYANMHYGAIIGGIVNNTLRPHVPNWCDPAWRTLMEQCWSADPNGRPSFTEIANRLRTMSFHSRGHGHHPHAHHG